MVDKLRYFIVCASVLLTAQQTNAATSSWLSGSSNIFTDVWKNWTIEADNLPLDLKNTASRCESTNQSAQTCPTTISIGPIPTPARERSVCPWYYVKDVDEFRLPRTIMRAKCRCDNCFASSRNVTGVTPGHEFNCLEMFVDVPVMYCSKDKVRCKASVSKIPVSCACVYRPTY